MAAALGVKTLPGAGTLTLATRKMLGGRETVLQYIRIAAADGDPHAEVFLHVWDDLKVHEQRVSTLDDVCAAAGVLPVKLVKAIVGSAFESGCDIANLVAATAHPDVVASTVKFAQKLDGVEDRKMLLQHAGFLPTPKGTTINVGVTANATAMAAAAASSDSSVPSFLEDMDEIATPVEQVQKQLIAASVPDPDLATVTSAPAVDAIVLEP